MNTESHARPLPIDQRDDDVSALEQRLQQDDDALGIELARLHASQGEIERRLKVLRSVVAEASLAGEQDKSLSERVARVAVPTDAEVSTQLEAVKTVRRRAIEDRRASTLAVRQAITHWKQQMAATMMQIQNDDKVAQQLLERGRAKVAAAKAAPPPLPVHAPVAQQSVARPVVSAPSLAPVSAPVVAAPVAAAPVVAVVHDDSSRPVASAIAEALEQLPTIDPTMIRKTPPPSAVAAMKRSSTGTFSAAPEGDGDASRRASPRVKLQVAIDLSSENNFFTGFSANISDGGIFIATVNHLKLGEVVDLSFTLPGGAHVEAHGEVRWLRDISAIDPSVLPGVGVQFRDLSAGAATAIKQFVDQREPMFLV